MAVAGSVSLLDCLYKSGECGICKEIKELRLLPCKHVICLQCLEKLHQKATQEDRKFSCTLCHTQLAKDPKEYPMNLLAREFNQQVRQLHNALQRRKDIISSQTEIQSLASGRQTLRLSRRSRRNDAERENQQPPPGGIYCNSGIYEVSSSDVEDDDSSCYLYSLRRLPEMCEQPDCNRLLISWFCTECELFLCSSCRVQLCEANEVHKIRKLEDEVEKFKKLFKELRKPIEKSVTRLSTQANLLSLEIRTLSKRLAHEDCDEMLATEVSKITKTDMELKETMKKQKKFEGTLSTLEEFDKEADDIEYVLISQWIFQDDNPTVSLGEANNLSYDAALGMCELISSRGCQGLAVVRNESRLLVTTGRSFYLIRLRLCQIQQGGYSSDSKRYAKIAEFKGKHCFLRRSLESSKREVVVLVPYTCQQLARWKVPKCDVIGGLAVLAEEVYITNKTSIDVYGINGERLKRIKCPGSKSIVDIAVYDTDKLAYCDINNHEVVILQKDGTVIWKVSVQKPKTVCSDLFNNLWVWSNEERCLKVIRSSGGPPQELFHPFFDQLDPTECVASMCVVDGSMWLACSRSGLFKFPLYVYRTDS